MRFSDLILAILFAGVGAGVGAASGSGIGVWCGGIVGFGLLWLVCTLNLRHMRRVLTSEDGRCSSQGDYKDYRLDSSWEGDGQIIDGENEPLWRYRSVGGNIFRSQVYGFFRLPPFVVRDMEGRGLLVFKRTKRFPFSVFEITEGNHVVGTIRKQSLLSVLTTKYSLEFESGLRCTLYMPRFTVWFHGIMETGGRVLIQEWHHRVWCVRFDSSTNNFHLAAAIALIHRERLRYG